LHGPAGAITPAGLHYARAMRCSAVLIAACVATSVCACGSSASSDAGLAAVTDRSLSDGLAVAEQRRLENQGLLDESIAPEGARCEGAEARWTCKLFVQVTDDLVDLRTYDVRVNAKGCWRALQTGADLRATGRPHRPTRPEQLSGCL
jgi:hypothetical protein